ncbi:hypothetical protein AB0G55_07605 [Streptomyces toyocaensis]|nr:hypothetical protein [Streptomyces toyocaensis]
MPETTDTTETAPQTSSDVVMRFLTVGGATVELRSHTFRTRYLAKGRPYIGDGLHTVEGFRWECLGCETTGRPSPGSPFDTDYLPNEREEARDHANQHASTCRAMPKPTAA